MNTLSTDTEWITIKEAARQLHVSTAFLRKAAATDSVRPCRDEIASFQAFRLRPLA